MNMLKLSKSLIAASMFVVFTLTLTGCWGQGKVAVTDAEKSREGVTLENYLPEDTLVMISLSTQDEEQDQIFQKLFHYFPQEDLDALWEKMMEKWEYEEDLTSIIGENWRLVFGIAGDMSQEEPDMYIAFTIADKEKAKSIIEQNLETDKNLKSGTVLGAITIDNESEDMYLAFYKDTILITNIRENRETALKRVVKNEKSILSNKFFKDSYKDLPKPNMGILFINLKELFTKIAEAEDEEIPNMAVLEVLYAEALAFVAEEDGIRVVVQVAFDEKNKDFNLGDFEYVKPYMYKNIPGDKLIMYMETYGLKEAFDLQMKFLMADDETARGIKWLKAILKAALSLDLDDDILSWMDRGFAFVMQHNKSIIPAISVYVDATTNPKNAKKILDLIDVGMQKAIEEMSENTPEELDIKEILKKDTVMLGKSQVNRVSFDISNLSEEELATAGIPSGVFVEPVEIYYGLTDENYFLFSTYTGLDKDYAGTFSVAENEIIKESQKYLKGSEYQFSYISVEETMNYVNTFVGFMEAIEGPVEKEVREGFQKVNSYLAPIKYIVAGNKKTENIAEGSMFVKMEQPEQP